MSGYGETGPLASYLSYGPILQAHAGFDEATGYEGGGPTRLGVAFPDPVGGVHGAFATLVALWERGLTGHAVHVDLSQFEALLSIAGELALARRSAGGAPVRHGNRSPDHSAERLPVRRRRSLGGGDGHRRRAVAAARRPHRRSRAPGAAGRGRRRAPCAGRGHRRRDRPLDGDGSSVEAARALQGVGIRRLPGDDQR